LEMVNGKERRREIVLEELVQIITEPVPEEAAQPVLKSTAHQLQFGLVADDTNIYSPQPALPSTGPMPKTSRRAVAGVMRLLAMIGVIMVAGVVYFQIGSNKSLVEPGVTFPIDTSSIQDITTTPPPSKPTDTVRVTKDTLAALPKTKDTLSLSRPAPKPVNPVTEWIKVRGGSFVMGCLDTADCEVNQSPVHPVRLTDFSMSVTEVTRAQYAHFLNDYGAAKVKDGQYKNEPLFAGAKWLMRDYAGKWSVQQGGGQLPACYITWYGANEFATFYGMKLPSEAQWEFAAKGGRTNSSLAFSGSDDMEEAGWYRGNSEKKLHQVRNKKPNALGLYDMSGNVWEWVLDCAHPNYKGAPSNGKAWTADGDCNRRMVRGGSFNLPSESSSVSSRMEARIGDAAEFIGFRVVK
jgi:sulfatase modifying factor 1